MQIVKYFHFENCDKDHKTKKIFQNKLILFCFEKTGRCFDKEMGEVSIKEKSSNHCLSSVPYITIAE